jgi:hypothetical protein
MSFKFVTAISNKKHNSWPKMTVKEKTSPTENKEFDLSIFGKSINPINCIKFWCSRQCLSCTVCTKRNLIFHKTCAF